MSRKSERLNLLVSPDEKAEIEAKAESMELTVSEYVRRAALSEEDPADASLVTALADEVGAMAERLDRKLEATIERLAEARARMDDREALRERALGEIKEHGLVWPFAVPASARAEEVT